MTLVQIKVVSLEHLGHRLRVHLPLPQLTQELFRSRVPVGLSSHLQSPLIHIQKYCQGVLVYVFI